MVKQDNLNYRLGFRADDQLLEGLERLAAKFKVGQSEVVRMGIKRLMESYLHVKSDVLIIDREKFDSITDKFMQRIEGEPKRQKEAMEKFTDSLMKRFIKEGILEKQ